MLSDRSVTGSESSVVGKMSDFVTPSFAHVETLCVPDVGLQPDFITFSSVVFEEKILGTSSVLAGGSLRFWRDSRLLHLGLMSFSQSSWHSFSVVRHYSTSHVHRQLLED